MLVLFAIVFGAIGAHYLFRGKASVPSIPTISVCGARQSSDIEQYTGPALLAPTTAIQKVIVPFTSVNMAVFHILASQNRAYILSYTASGWTMRVYNLSTGAFINSFSVAISGNSRGNFALDSSGNVYVIDAVDNPGLYKYNSSGTLLWTKPTPGGSGGAYGYIDSSGTFLVGVLPPNGRVGSGVNQTGSSLVFDQNGNTQPNNNMLITGNAEQDPTTGDILSIDGGMFRVYTNSGALKFQMGTDLDSNQPGPWHFYIPNGAVEKPGGAGYYISDSGHGMESFDASGGYLGMAPDFQAANSSPNTIGVNPGNAVIYNGSVYYLLNGGIDSFDSNNNKQGIYSISLTNLDTYTKYPQSARIWENPAHLGIGAGMYTSVKNNYFPNGTTPQVFLQFYQWWQAQAGAFTGNYTVRSIQQIKAGMAGSTSSFTIPSASSSYTNGVANVPITLPQAQPGLYEISMHLLKNGQPAGADCLYYTVGAINSGFNPASPNMSGTSDLAGIELAHEFGQKLFRSSYGLPDCYPGVTAPTMSTPLACPTSIVNDVAAAAALASQYGMNYEIQIGAANTWPYITAGNAVFQHLIQQMAAGLPSVKNWECWNEPDTNNFTSGLDYVNRALIPCYQGVKAVQPNDLVIGGSFSNMTPTNGWWNDFVTAGLPYVDIIALHTYTGHNRSFEEQGHVIPPLYSTKGETGTLQQFQAKFAAAGYTGQIWDTEQGFWVSGPYNIYTQGDRVVRKQILERSIGITNVSNFQNNADYEIGSTVFSLLTKGSLTSGGVASVIYGDQLNSRQFVAWLPTNTPHTYAAKFGPSPTDTGSVVVVWSDDFNVNVVPTLSGGGTLNITDEFGLANTINSGSSLGLSGSVQYLAVPNSKTLTIAPTEGFTANVLTGSNVTASSSYNCGGYNLTPDRVLDGILDTQNAGNICDGQGMSLWVGAVGDNSPSVTVNLPSPKSIDRVYVSSQGIGSIEVGLRNYTVSFDTGSGSFTNPIVVTNQFLARNNLLQLPQSLTISRIKISGIEVNYSGYGDGLPPVWWPTSGAPGEPTIYEVEAYGPGSGSPPPTLSADFNNDGHVDTFDLSILASHFGSSSVSLAQGDSNGDGAVNVLDLAILASQWGL